MTLEQSINSSAKTAQLFGTHQDTLRAIIEIKSSPGQLANTIKRPLFPGWRGSWQPSRYEISHLKLQRHLVPCLVEEAVMAGLLLLGLLACFPLATPITPTLLLSEICYHFLDLEELEYRLTNTTTIMSEEGQYKFFSTAQNRRNCLQKF